jgi:DNA repair protein RecO (recombination protein O)
VVDRERLYKTEGVVLKRSDMGEADRLLVLLTPGLGKLRVVAKGVRKVPSRKAGHVEPFMRSHFLMARGRNLDIVTQAEVLEPHAGLRGDLLRMTYACYLAELVDAFSEEGAENEPLYRLLCFALERLAAGDDPALLARFFEMRLLGYVGYRPELRRCIHCGREHEPGRGFFCPDEGGVRCPECGELSSNVRELSLGAFKVLRYLQSQEYPAVAALQIRPETCREIEVVLRGYLVFVLERGLKSVEFLNMVKASWGGSGDNV